MVPDSPRKDGETLAAWMEEQIGAGMCVSSVGRGHVGDVDEFLFQRLNVGFAPFSQGEGERAKRAPHN